MGFDTQKSFIMAERLKQLREEKGLSHEKLSKALSDQYGVKISTDSLINYEVANADHTKAYKNQGMRVEYLRVFANFYNVSTDYLLGITYERTQDLEIRDIVKKTGLSEESVQYLVEANSQNLHVIPLVIHALLLEDKYRTQARQRNFRSIIDLLWFFMEFEGTNSHLTIDTRGNISEADPSNIFTDTIALDNTIVENAALFEMQQILIEFKKSFKKVRRKESDNTSPQQELVIK